ncbi:MAG: peptide ABC transporter substrate-binding protein [Anaerolineales bacterium]
MRTKKLSLVFGLLVIASMMLAACGGGGAVQTVVVTEQVQGETVTTVVTATPETEGPGPVTMHGADTSDIPDLDPQIAEDVTSINYIENLFVHLTNYDAETAEITPEAATDWTISDDGLTYTFTIRTDIPWVNHNPVTGETTQVTDADGNPRFVTASDFVFGIKRACDPNIGSYYSGVIAPQVKGCSDVLNYEDPTAVPQELIDAIGVSAPADDTLVIELAFPASYFMSMTPMWTLTATPQWAIEANGDNWVEAGNIVTNGRYVLHEWVHGVRRAIWRNPLMPADMQGDGNIERIVTNVVPDVSTEYSLWLNGELESSPIPDAELQAHLDQYPDETVQVADLAVFYISFAYDKPPFDDARVRAAFSGAFDRQTFVDEVRQGQGLPMKHFAPPGIFGAPAIDEVGVGFDPEFAAQQLADAGYPNCEGFPQVTLLGYSGQSTLNWIEFAQSNWSENLGCSADLIQIEQQSFADLLAATAASTPTEDRPHMWTLGWGPDYADENNWVGDVLWCENSANRQKRPCNATDDMIVQAREESDPAVRQQLYSQIEENFFGEGGEFPFAPLFVRIAYVARHSWFQHTESLFGGQQWYNSSIDQAAQMSAMGG